MEGRSAALSHAPEHRSQSSPVQVYFSNTLARMLTTCTQHQLGRTTTPSMPRASGKDHHPQGCLGLTRAADSTGTEADTPRSWAPVVRSNRGTQGPELSSSAQTLASLGRRRSCLGLPLPRGVGSSPAGRRGFRSTQGVS